MPAGKAYAPISGDVESTLMKLWKSAALLVAVYANNRMSRPAAIQMVHFLNMGC